MLQEIVEGKWIASFRRALELNGIGKGSQITVVAEIQFGIPIPTGTLYQNFPEPLSTILINWS